MGGVANHRIWAPWRLAYVKDASKDSEAECIFCTKPAEDDDEANLIVHRGEKCFVILNLFPYTNGHLMIAPYAHLAALPDLDAATAAEMMALAQRAIVVLDDKYRPQGYNAGLQPGTRCRSRLRVAHPPPRRPSMGRRHELHAGARRHARHASVARRELPGAEGRVLSAADPAGPAVPEGIFKAYDIRGLYGSEMDGDTAYLLGRAFARVLAGLRGKEPFELRVGLGRDMRIEAPQMSRRLRDGLTDEGCSVLDAGMVATEMLYHLVGSRQLDGGAMVTASHNPKAYTGVKLVREGALPLSGDAGIGDVRATIEAGMPDPAGGGSVEAVDVYDDYHDRVLSFIDPDRVSPMRVVVDGGNGMAGPMVGPILERLGLEPVTTYWVPDGEFPDHEPNPLIEQNRQFIIGKVLEEKADLGIAWDGDADRCFFIDDQGEFVDGDFLTALLARQLLREASRAQRSSTTFGPAGRFRMWCASSAAPPM